MSLLWLSKTLKRTVCAHVYRRVAVPARLLKPRIGLLLQYLLKGHHGLYARSPVSVRHRFVELWESGSPDLGQRHV